MDPMQDLDTIHPVIQVITMIHGTTDHQCILA